MRDPNLQHPLVSVILPVFNGEKYVEEAIQSVLSQGYHPLEVIVVDDGSTDKTAKILQKFPEPVRYFYQENAGPAVARNHGIQQARGEFIAFIDADDLWAPNKQAHQMAFFEDFPQADIVQGLIERRWFPSGETNSDGFRDPDFLFIYTNLGTMTIRRSVFDQIGYFDPSLKYHEDTDLWLRAREAGLVLVVQRKKALIYRIHGSNLTTGLNIETTGFPGILRRSINRRRQSDPKDQTHAIPNLFTTMDLDHTGSVNTYTNNTSDRPTICMVLHLTANQNFICNTIQSIESQSLQPDELIVIGKISEGIASRIKKSFKNPILINMATTDLALQLNTAIQAAHGAWVAFIGSDVEWPEEKLQRQVEYAEQNPQQTVLVGYARHVIDPAAQYPKAILDNLAFRKNLGDMLDTMLVRHDTLTAVGPFSQDKPGMEETDWLLRASDLGFTKTMMKEPMLFRYVSPNLEFTERETIRTSLLDSVYDSILRKRQVKKSTTNQDR